MGRHNHDDASITGDWEEPPPVAPLWRTRIVTSAVLLLAVVAATWWVVSWLTSPAGPGASAPQAAVLDGQDAELGGGTDGGGPVEGQQGGEGQSKGHPTGPGQAGGGQSGAEETVEGQSAGTAGSSSEAVIIHVAGEVHEPGLVGLPAGSRVADALQAAGGPTNRAELDLLNLAAPAVDASQILVPGPDTPAAAGATAPGTSPTPAAGARSGTAGAGGPGSAATVNVNTADAAALEQLPGIGPALAGRIVEHRDQVGPYGSLADLDAVSGIGPAMMERLDGLVSW